MATSYALTPIPLIFIPATVLSNFLIQSEGPFFNLLLAIAGIWALILIFSGTLSIHDYTATKNIIVTIATLIGMGVVMFVALLFFSLFEMLIGFVRDVTVEVTERM